MSVDTITPMPIPDPIPEPVEAEAGGTPIITPLPTSEE